MWESLNSAAFMLPESEGGFQDPAPTTRLRANRAPSKERYDKQYTRLLHNAITFKISLFVLLSENVFQVTHSWWELRCFNFTGNLMESCFIQSAFFFFVTILNL